MRGDLGEVRRSEVRESKGKSGSGSKGFECQ